MERQEKKDQRRRLRALLRDLDPATAASWSAAVSDHLLAWLPPTSGNVAVYAPIAGEPDLSRLQRQSGPAAFLYPLVNGDELTFHAVPSPDQLRTGSFGIAEPDPDRHPQIAIGEIRVFLCPGLGFAPDGVRLGRGKGFYDRALAHARPDALRVGVGFSNQLCDNLRSDSYDQRMTHLADEHGVRDVRC